MRSRTAVVAGLLVLAGGGGLALVFHTPPPMPVAVHVDEAIQHRADDGPRFLMEVRSATPHPSWLEEPTGGPLPYERTELSGLPLFEGAEDSVPHFARRYPSAAEAALVPVVPQTRHRVIDGDTLPVLAERYLGDAERAVEIFEANRDVLTTPDLLPIGAVLRIPARD